MMNSRVISILLAGGFVVSFGHVRSEEEPALRTARIIGGVSDGSPTPHSPPRVLPEFNVIDSKVIVERGRTITMKLVEKPDFPEAPLNVQEKLTAEEVQKFASSRDSESEGPSEFCFISAMVYDHNRTFVQWWPEGRAESCEGWSNVDFNHLGGFHAFEGRGQKYFFIMGVTNVEFQDLRGDRLENMRREAFHVPSLEER